MKKLFVIISYILLATTMVSCAYIPKMNDTDKNDFSTQAAKDYVIYYYPSAGESIKGESGLVDITFKDAQTKVFSFSSKTKIDKPSDAGNQHTFELNGKTHSLEYNRTYETALSSSNAFKKYSKFNEYKSDTIRLETRVSSNELMSFINLDENDWQVIGTVNEDEAKAIAETTILSLYGEEVKKEYEYDKTVYTDAQLSRHYTVLYRRFVWGMPSNDTISISVNLKGDVVGINAKSLGIFSLAEKQVEKKAIADAISTLEGAFSKDWTIGNKTLILDAEGDYYISAQLYRKNTEEFETMVVYINIV